MEKLTKIRTGLLLIFIIFSGANSSKAQNKPTLVSPLLTGHYMPGIINIRDFADPSPVTGIILLDYNVFPSSSKFYGADGKQVTQIKGPLGSNIDLHVDISGYINTPFPVFASKFKILGATYLGGATLGYTTTNISQGLSRIGNVDSIHQSGNVNANVHGISDLGVMPIFLSWGLKQMDITAGYMFYAPTGNYEPGGNNNTGLGYWSHLFQCFLYYYPMKIGGKPSKALAIMFATTFELTSKIKNTDVNPGNRFDLDYGISQYLSERFSLGIYGGNSWQVSEDQGSQVYWNNEIKDRYGVLGFQAAYWLWTNRLQAVGKYGFNYGVVQNFKLNTVEINLVFITNALTGNKSQKK
jgi:hypothetical protein